jgi:hydroxyacylglutathione hydrolase
MPSIIPIPAFRDNYIWLIRQGSHAAVVDAGDAAPVIAYLEREALELSAIICTHHHNDHVGGNVALLERWPVPVFGPAHETIPGRTHALGEGDRIDVPGIEATFDVLDIPGHTAGHIAFVGSVDGPAVFCGDTLFAVGCGRLFEGTPAQMWSSLSKLAGHEYTLANIRFALAVEPDIRALVARQAREAQRRTRGEPTLPSTIGDEGETNPFLRATRSNVREAAEAHAGHTLADPVATFAMLRAWKNAFQ